MSAKTVIEHVAKSYADKRRDVFHVTATEESDVVRLAGRVLDASALQAARAAFAGRQVDDSGVRVLRSATPTMMTVATNLTDLHVEPSWLSELLTQVLNGTPLEVLEESDKWVYVRQPDSYLGWAYKPYLRPFADVNPSHWVTAPSSPLYALPSNDGPPRAVLLCGTPVEVVETQDGWMKLQPAGDMLAGGWMAATALRAIQILPPAEARAQIIADAHNLTGVYYLWGGSSPFGIDCSALAQLTHRLAGYTLPRDAYMQFAECRRVEPPYEPGDLLFFHGEVNTDRITHVGISLGGWQIIHSSRSRNGVYLDDVQQSESLKKTFVGGGTFVDRPAR